MTASNEIGCTINLSITRLRRNVDSTMSALQTDRSGAVEVIAPLVPRIQRLDELHL